MLPFSAEDLARVLDALALGYADSTLETYAAGLLLYHVWCDTRGVAEEDQTPITMTIIELFTAAMVGSYSETAVNNYVSGLHTWHVLHGLPWDIDRQRLKVMLRAADRVAPVTRGKRPPLTVDILAALRPGLDLAIPLDAAVWAALLTVFWCTARRGEFVLKTLSSFEPDKHVQRVHYRTEERDGVPVHIFALPWTKTRCYDGEKVFFVPQPSLSACDPLPAFKNHLLVNDPTPEEPLFSYNFKNSRHPLTGHAMQRRLKVAAVTAQIDLPPGHSARIGSLLWHLLNGMPFLEAMAKGRWQSLTSFHIYLRQHAQVLAPHLQARPHIYSELNHRILDATRALPTASSG